MLRLVSSSYSRKNELEADQHILTVFARTGHHVRQGCGIYETLLETVPKKAKGTTSLFAGHPDTQKRLDALLEASANLPAPNDQAEPDASYMALKQTFPTRQHYLRNG
jgi:predicted Zn-dependent protease